MTILHKLLRNVFGYAAIVSAAVFATMVPVLLHSPFPHATARFHADPYGLLLIAMRELILFMPPVMAIVNGMAWLALRKSFRSARAWAMAASASFLILSAPIFVSCIVILQYHLVGTFGLAGVLILFLVLNSMGFAGVAAFAKRDAMAVSVPSRRAVSSHPETFSVLASAR